MSHDDGGIVTGYVERLQATACKAEERKSIDEDQLREVVETAVAHIKQWKCGTPLENLKVLRGRLLWLVDITENHSIYQRVLAIAAQMVERTIDSFRPLPSASAKGNAEKAQDAPAGSAKAIRLTTGVQECLR